MKFDFATQSVLMAAFAPLIALILGLAIDRRNRKRTEKPPQGEKLLRPPGHSLAIRLDETIEKILLDILTACALSAFAAASALSVAQCVAAQAPAWLLLIFALLLAGSALAGILAALRAFARMREAQNIRLGLRGEQAVAEALNEAADCGFRAFHDLPGGENWNIDHVAVCARGVFLIETKARRRYATRGEQPDHKVIYDGETLEFPAGTDRKSISQAHRNAKWLADFLTKKTGEPVSVSPVLVLPGWYIESKGNFRVKVMNAAYLAKFLRCQSELIEPAQVRRIISALDEKCRDVEF